jgi:acetyltransferase-like isoleucine patch superfamily enzyme
MFSKYGVKGTIYMALCLIRTKLFYSKARIIRFPFDIRGKRYIDLGEGLTTGKGCRLEAFPKDKGDKVVMRFGKGCQINDYCHISAMEEVVIEDGVLLAGKVYISDNSHGYYKLAQGGGIDNSLPTVRPIDREYYTSPIRIGKNTWIAENVVVMPGVSIGEGCVIGANSVVTKSIDRYSMAVGVPAKVIKRYNEKSKCWESVG